MGDWAASANAVGGGGGGWVVHGARGTALGQKHHLVFPGYVQGPIWGEQMCVAQGAGVLVPIPKRQTVCPVGGGGVKVRGVRSVGLHALPPMK